jgi:hypothetical protein
VLLPPYKLGDVAATDSTRALLRLRIAVLGQLAFYAVLVLVFTNVPHGWNGVVNYGLEGVDVFRESLRYPTLALSPRAFTVCGYVCFGGLWALFVAALQAAVVLDRDGTDRRAFAVLIGGAIAQHALLVFFLPPVLSQDLYRYAAYGRMVAFSGANPYTTPIEAMPFDPVTTLADWRSATSTYGAFFTWVSAGAAWLGGDSPVRTAWVFKGVAALANLVIAWCAFRLSRRGGSGNGFVAASFCALGPVFVIEGAGSGHNEAIMMAAALLGLLWWREGRIVPATIALTLSMYVKFITGALLLLLFARALRRPRPGTSRAATAAKVIGAVAGVTLALYAHFGWTPATWGFGAVRDLLVKGRSISGGAPPSLFCARALLFAAIVGVSLWFGWRTNRPLEAELMSLWSLLFVVLVYEWHYAWYFVPAAALAAAAPASRLRRPLRFAALALAFGWSLAYPVIEKKHSVLFQPFVERLTFEQPWKTSPPGPRRPSTLPSQTSGAPS